MNQKLKRKNHRILIICAARYLHCINPWDHHHPIPLDPLMLFLAGAAFLIIGMGFFTLGVDMAMMPIGEKVGAQLAKAKSFRSSSLHVSS